MATPIRQKSRAGPSITWENADEILKEWATQRPRFLFRGFHAVSGGGPEALVRNDTKRIIPHLFGGAESQTLNKMWSLRAGIRVLSPPEVMKLIKTHLEMRIKPTIFSSWTADFQTALLSAIEATKGDYEHFQDYPDLSKRHIAILDTSRLEVNGITEVLPVSALHEAKFAETDHPYDYLVYGPVRELAFCAVPLSDLSSLGFDPRDVHGEGGLTSQLNADSVLRAKEIAKKFRRENNQECDIVLAVIAAELSRQRAPRMDLKVSDMFKYRWKDEEVELIVDLLKDDIAQLKLDDGGMRPLINRAMHVHHFPQLHLMTRLLDAFMDAAWTMEHRLNVPGHTFSHGEKASPWHLKCHPTPGLRKLSQIRKRPGSRALGREPSKLGSLLATTMGQPSDGTMDRLKSGPSQYVRAESVAEIIAEAMKSIARLNLEEFGE
ncbi:hypothetical protein Daus18300_009376 [Diaporthe australafricana]|uniref:Uncharacterized protein n=1 Tax=Diaporthe australafricana TaxID=127596 RepID=A0ABR3WEK2_9PEZI